MIDLRNFSIIYPDGTKAIDHVTLSLKKEENTALIGANGAGKTSFIMAMVGILPFQGEVRINGIPLEKKTVKEIRDQTGVLFQNPDDQLFMPSIYEDIAFGLRNRGWKENEIEQQVERCLSQLHITHLRNKTALKISGGEKRMAALATILVMNPSVLLLDEPTAFLDPKARRSLIYTLSCLPETKLIATHDLTFAEETCSRCILLKDGKIFADGMTKELLYDASLMEACGVEAIGTHKSGGRK